MIASRLFHNKTNAIPTCIHCRCAQNKIKIVPFVHSPEGKALVLTVHSRETRNFSRETRLVSRETRRVSRDGGNLHLSGTVQVLVQFPDLNTMLRILVLYLNIILYHNIIIIVIVIIIITNTFPKCLRTSWAIFWCVSNFSKSKGRTRISLSLLKEELRPEAMAGK